MLSRLLPPPWGCPQRGGAQADAAAVRGSRPWEQTTRSMSAPWGVGGIYRCPGITSFPRQLGSEQTHSTAQKGAGGYNQLTPRLLQSHQLLLQEKAY